MWFMREDSSGGKGSEMGKDDLVESHRIRHPRLSPMRAHSKHKFYD